MKGLKNFKESLDDFSSAVNLAANILMEMSKVARLIGKQKKFLTKKQFKLLIKHNKR